MIASGMEQLGGGISHSAVSLYVKNIPDEPENLTLRLLQEMQDELREVRWSQDNTNEKITDLTRRVDGNTLTFNLVAGVV